MSAFSAFVQTSSTTTGPRFTYMHRSTEPATSDGLRAVAVTITHARRGSWSGVVVMVQPCWLNDSPHFGTLATYPLFGSGLLKSSEARLLATGRRNNATTATVARRVAPLVPALAAAWLNDPASSDSTQALDDIIDAATVQSVAV